MHNIIHYYNAHFILLLITFYYTSRCFYPKYDSVWTKFFPVVVTRLVCHIYKHTVLINGYLAFMYFHSDSLSCYEMIRFSVKKFVIRLVCHKHTVLINVHLCIPIVIPFIIAVIKLTRNNLRYIYVIAAKHFCEYYMTSTQQYESHPIENS